MLDIHSSLAGTSKYARNGVMLSESSDFTLTQISGDEKPLKKALGKLPAKLGQVLEDDGTVLMRIGPQQIWCVGDAPESLSAVYLTPLSSGRCRLLLEGDNARRVLSACALIDFDPAHFKRGQFVMTSIHHTPVLIHCIDDHAFHIYAMRTFALNVWEWLCDIADGL
jgi:methylglutamate dehydrogenase subunit D